MFFFSFALKISTKLEIGITYHIKDSFVEFMNFPEQNAAATPKFGISSSKNEGEKITDIKIQMVTQIICMKFKLYFYLKALC